MLSVKGIYENGKIELLEPIPYPQKAKVIVTILEELEEIEDRGFDPEEEDQSIFEDMIGIISERNDGSTNHDHYLSEPKSE